MKKISFIILLLNFLLIPFIGYAQEALTNPQSASLGSYVTMKADYDSQFDGIDFSQYKGTYGFDFETQNPGKGRFGYTHEEIALLKQKYPDGEVYQINSIYKDEVENKVVFELIIQDMPADAAVEEYEAKTGKTLISVSDYNTPFHLHYIFANQEDAESFIKRFDDAPKSPSVPINMIYWKLTDYPEDLKALEDNVADALYYESVSEPQFGVTFVFEKSAMSSWDAWKDSIGMGYSGLKEAYGDACTFTDSSTMSAVIDLLKTNEDIVLNSKLYQPQKSRTLDELLENKDVFQF